MEPAERRSSGTPRGRIIVLSQAERAARPKPIPAQWKGRTMRYELFVADHRGHETYEFDEYPEAHRRFFKCLRLARKYYPGSAYLYLATAGYDEVAGWTLIEYTPENGLVIHEWANENEVY